MVFELYLNKTAIKQLPWLPSALWRKPCLIARPHVLVHPRWLTPHCCGHVTQEAAKPHTEDTAMDTYKEAPSYNDSL